MAAFEMRACSSHCVFALLVVNSFASPALCMLRWRFFSTVQVIDKDMQRVSPMRNTVCMCIHLLNQLLHYITKVWVSCCFFYRFLCVGIFGCGNILIQPLFLVLGFLWKDFFKQMFQIEMTSGECSLARSRKVLIWQCTGCKVYIIYSTAITLLCCYIIVWLRWLLQGKRHAIVAALGELFIIIFLIGKPNSYFIELHAKNHWRSTIVHQLLVIFLQSAQPPFTFLFVHSTLALDICFACLKCVARRLKEKVCACVTRRVACLRLLFIQMYFCKTGESTPLSPAEIFANAAQLSDLVFLGRLW